MEYDFSHSGTTVEQLKNKQTIKRGCSQWSTEKVFSVGDQTITRHFCWVDFLFGLWNIQSNLHNPSWSVFLQKQCQSE